MKHKWLKTEWLNRNICIICNFFISSFFLNIVNHIWYSFYIKMEWKQACMPLLALSLASAGTTKSLNAMPCSYHTTQQLRGKIKKKKRWIENRKKGTKTSLQMYSYRVSISFCCFHTYKLTLVVSVLYINSSIAFFFLCSYFVPIKIYIH